MAEPGGESGGEFAGLTALVTGGASGIGLATAQLLTSRGARVAVLDRDKADEKHGLISVVADVTDDDAVRRAVAEAVAALGDQLDILVNNAGIGAAGTVEDNPDDEWHRVLDINVVGMARVSRAALEHLRRAVADRGQAAIVNTCSVAAIAGLPQRVLYSASKGAVYGLTLAMAADHVREGIRVNCVIPGTADTPWIGRLLSGRPRPGGRARRPQRPPAHGPAGHRGRGGRGHHLPGQPVVQCHHRHRPAGRRGHDRPAPPPPAHHLTRAAGTHAPLEQWQ